MRPDTSNWRDDRSYDFFDTLPIEGLAWECLRRYRPYQDDYARLVDAGAELSRCLTTGSSAGVAISLQDQVVLPYSNRWCGRRRAIPPSSF
ncbi:MAG: DUF6499 domain-containing protein [Rhizobiaceae bacterium]